MTVEIRGLDPSDQRDVDAAAAIETAAFASYYPDLPISVPDFAGRLRHPWPGRTQAHWLAFVDGAPAGRLMVSLPQLDNTHLADLDPVVHPEFTRRGVGRSLFETGLAYAREHGRTVLQGEYVTQLPGGPHRSARHAAFADAMGAKAALPEVRRRLSLPTVEPGVWQSLKADAQAHAAGYSLLRWRDRSPDDIVADIAHLDGRMVLDAPMGDLILEQERIDEARVRAAEEVLAALGRRCYHTGARHDATGRLVAWTAINFETGVDEHAYQAITIVDPAHRGHRLGALVKLDNMEHVLAYEPQVRDIDTWNAAVNTHMIGINEAMGYRPVDGWVAWQVEL